MAFVYKVIKLEGRQILGNRNKSERRAGKKPKMRSREDLLSISSVSPPHSHIKKLASVEMIIWLGGYLSEFKKRSNFFKKF